MQVLHVVTHTKQRKNRDGCATQSAHRHITDFSHHSLCLCAAVILMNDWRQVCWERGRMSNLAEPLCSVPAKQPRSNTKVACFNNITPATEMAVEVELAEGWCLWSGCKQMIISYTFRIESCIRKSPLYQGIYRSLKPFPSTSSQQCIGASQSIKAFP